MPITNVQPDMLVLLLDYLLTLTAVTDLVGQNIFTHSIPKGFTKTTCILLNDVPNANTDPNSPITTVSIAIQTYSLSKSEAVNIERTAIFPNLHSLERLESDGNKWIAVQSQSRILLQDPDYVGELWYTNSEYDITLLYC